MHNNQQPFIYHLKTDIVFIFYYFFFFRAEVVFKIMGIKYVFFKMVLNRRLCPIQELLLL
jgi:hypothetical protein